MKITKMKTTKMSNIEEIKKSYVCRFHTACSGCAKKNLCVSASSLTSEPREYLLRNKGYRVPRNEAMQRGIIRHELYQQGMRSALVFPFHVMRRELFSGREIVFKEFQVCSTFYALRGVIDVLRFQYDRENKVMNVVAEEIKSSYWKKYFQQLAVYGLILSDLNFLFVQEVTKRKTRRIIHKFYPREQFNLNIKVILQVFAKKPIEIEWMQNNLMTEWANGISAGVMNKAKSLNSLHKLGIYWLQELPPCGHCRGEECGFYDRFCSKLGKYVNEDSRQMYWGKNFDRQMLIKTKPKLNLAELEGMVRIK